jgi:hypothetical protein
LVVARLDFPLKVSFAVALGKVDPADAGGFNAFNKLRKKFAHDVEMELTKEHESDLYNGLSSSQRKIIERPRKAERMLLRRLRFDIMGLIANANHP